MLREINNSANQKVRKKSSVLEYIKTYSQKEEGA